MISLKTKILVVDDMVSTCEMILQMLHQLGFLHASAVHSAEAAKKELFQEVGGDAPFGLVLLDINMPGENGLSMLQWMRSTPSLKNLPVVIVSAAGDIDNVMKAVESGAQNFLVKPVMIEQLRAKLERL